MTFFTFFVPGLFVIPAKAEVQVLSLEFNHTMFTKLDFCVRGNDDCRLLRSSPNQLKTALLNLLRKSAAYAQQSLRNHLNTVQQ